MNSLYESNEPIDNVSLYEELRKDSNEKINKVEESGGATYISKLSEDISSAANIDYHARVVLEKWDTAAINKYIDGYCRFCLRRQP
jgi:replicative DNA helicase